MKRSIALSPLCKIMTQKCFLCVLRRSQKSQLQRRVLFFPQSLLSRKEIGHSQVALCLEVLEKNIHERKMKKTKKTIFPQNFAY